MVLSDIMTKAKLNYVANSWIDELMSSLGVKKRYVSYDSVMKNRKMGLNSAKIIRSMRDGMAKKISR